MRRILLITAMCVLALSVNGQAQTKFILTTSPSSVQDVCNRHSLSPVSTMWSTNSTGVYVVNGPGAVAVSDVETDVSSDLAVYAFEPEQTASMVALSTTTSASLQQSVGGFLESLSTVTTVGFYGATVPSIYTQQPALSILRISDGRNATGLTGVGTVALIDTGVDPNHPALSGVLVPGYDFTRNIDGIPSELNDLDPATAATLTQSVGGFLEGQTVVPVNSSSLAVLAQSVGGFLESSLPLPSTFGHGTMTAGLVHLIAPTARIMPLKAFTANGTAKLSDIIRAIYYAANHGANVISMSFELPASSPGLRQALNFAQNRGVILVAASGNDASSATVWPAGLSNVLGIGSTSNLDVKSTFSNFGSPDVTFAAPGEGVISTYPGGNYAAGWGTSFSAPLVAGAAALLQQKNPQGGYSWIYNALDKSTVPVQNMNRGRVDLYKALLYQ